MKSNLIKISLALSVIYFTGPRLAEATPCIKVDGAIYGYKNAGANVVNVIQQHCDGKPQCVLPVINNQLVGCDPMRGYHKQLIIDYSCYRDEEKFAEYRVEIEEYSPSSELTCLSIPKPYVTSQETLNHLTEKYKKAFKNVKHWIGYFFQAQTQAQTQAQVQIKSNS